MQRETQPLPRAAQAFELHRFPADENRPDVIALHGLMQTLHSWRHLRPKPAEHGNRLCAFDLKGHRGSRWTPGENHRGTKSSARALLLFGTI
jgi:alpha-beta hydrolase superfamily lysophospholipase